MSRDRFYARRRVIAFIEKAFQKAKRDSKPVGAPIKSPACELLR
jgi:hypothetical protein